MRQHINAVEENGRVNYIDGDKNHFTIAVSTIVPTSCCVLLKKGRAGEIYNAASFTTSISWELFETTAEIVQVPVVGSRPFCLVQECVRQVWRSRPRGRKNR